jgi:hypothetical protein
VVAIRTLLDTSTLSVADLTRRLKAAEESFEGPPSLLLHDGKLYLTEEEWNARRKQREAENRSSGGAGGSSARRGGRRGRGRGRGGDSGSSSSTGPGNSMGKVGKDQCRRCGKTGHWARDCPLKPKREAAHVVQDEEEALLLLVRSTPFLPLSAAAPSPSPPADGGSTPAPADALGGRPKDEPEAATPLVATSTSPGGARPDPLRAAAAPSDPPPSSPAVGGSTSAPAKPLGGRPEEEPEVVTTATLLVATSASPGGARPDPLRAAAASSGAVTARLAAGSGSQVRLIEHKVFVHLSEEEKNRDTMSWVLDTGATNHMSGARMAFVKLDTAVRGSVSFGDGSVANIEDCGTVLFNCKNGEHRSFAGVYYIPRLTSNIISIGQLDEAGYKINIDDGVLRIRKQSRRLLARVPRRPDRLYVLDLDVARPVCLAARGKEEAWRWHARMGHINMNALRKLAWEEMVRGLPPIEQVDKLCDACLAGKQRRNSFPEVARYRAERTLEIVHGDLCGPISPATPSGGRFFLLLVDDKSRFMWLSVMSTKDQAAAAIKVFQERTEAESGLKLGVLRTDRGGEFTSVEFAEYCAAEGV